MISTILSPPNDEVAMHILHLEDSALDHQLLLRTLSKAGLTFKVTRVDTLSAFQQALLSGGFHLVVADYRLGEFTAIDAWNSCTNIRDAVPFIILSGTIGEAAAVEAIQSGICDYLHKDEISTLPRVIQRTMEIQAIKAAKEMADRELALSEQRISELAGHLQNAIERERASIAREVHDDIGGALAAIRLDLGWLARHTVDPQSLQRIETASEMVLHAANASQRIMRNLRPAILDQGLIPSIEWLAHNFEQRTTSKVEVTTTTNKIELSPEIMLTAYRTTQEALTNIAKYAEGCRVKIDVSHLGGTLTVEVADDGPGMEKGALGKQLSFGLRGLAERAKSVGGWLDVSSALGRGTTITLTIPLVVSPSSKSASPS
ncbi:MAG: sensor histidine kinase [Curvibacter sp.]|nr:MAG: sensor histidine kinase [Curvibacter sp.]